MDQYIWKNVAEYLENCVKESKRVLPISVNASRIDFYRDNLYEHFTELLKEYNLASKYLELEVTESAYTADEDVIYSTLEQLQRVGMTILIDDFGSGYSSFNMMKQAPVDVLKLDMEFLRGLDEGGRGKTIVKHMVQLGTGSYDPGDRRRCGNERTCGTFTGDWLRLRTGILLFETCSTRRV